ncbi:01e32f75-3780-4dab-9dd7-92587acc3353 [Thermothielavioides terrestris]
MPLVV